MDAFATSCLPYRDELLRIAMRLARNPDDAADLVQDTYAKALLAWDRFEAGTNVRAWLYKILINGFITAFRKRQRQREIAAQRGGDILTATYGDTDGLAPDPSASHSDEFSDEVRIALTRLGPDSHDVIARADLAGEKYGDIARTLKIPIGTVMSRLFRARRQLEADLAPYAASTWGLRR